MINRLLYELKLRYWLYTLPRQEEIKLRFRYLRSGGDVQC